VLKPGCVQSDNIKKISGLIFPWVSGTGDPPVQVQVKACGHKKYLPDCNSVLIA
jgi:hypothetical protein